MSSEKLMLIDGNSILNRAYFGLKPKEGDVLATSDGFPTNALFGFLNILKKYVDEENPQYMCVAFDLKAPTFRHKEYDGYKAKRKGMPDELALQLPVMKEILDAMNIKRLETQGYEADDIIGTVSLMAENSGLDVVVITGDRDSLQLVSESTRVKIPVTRGGKTETEEYDLAKMNEKYGVTPTQFIDLKGLMGDTSDNIPGVPGIGEKTALDLIKKFKSMDELFEDLSKVDKKGVREKLEANRELAFLSKRLATIDRHMPENWAVDNFKRGEYDTQKLYEIFKRLEFKSFIEKYNLSTLENQELKEIVIDNYEYIDTKEGLESIVNSIKESKEFSIYHLVDKKDGFDNKLIAATLTWEVGKTAYIDIVGCTENSFFDTFKSVFQDESIKKFGHDIKNLIVYFRRKGIDFKGLAFDTMIGAYLLSPSNDTYTVSELAEKYLDSRIQSIESLSGKGKSFVLFADMEKETLSSAAVLHSEVVFRLKGEIDRILSENDQSKLYYDIELPLINVLAGMEYWGFKVNPQELAELSKELKEKIDALEEEIYGLAGEVFNINSTKQLGVILFEKLELPIIKKTKTGYSTDAQVLEELESRHEIVKKILEYRQLVKLRSTYADGLMGVINPSTGRIHSSFNQTVTVTGRISSTEPNLQNIPMKLEMGRKIRKVFIPQDEEYILLDADYSQIELRVLAHITGDENMIAAFIENEDIHTNTASRVFGIDKSEVTQLMRSRAKAVNFGIVYGIGDYSLSKDLGITRKEARKYIDEYLNKYVNVKKYMHDIVEQGKKNGFVTTLFNRRRYIKELKSSNFNMRSFGERVAMNTPIQGSAADIIKIAMVKVNRELERNNLKSRLILQVHDELIIEAYKPEKEIVERIMKESMENAVSLNVPLRADVKCGTSWYEAK